MKVGVLEAGQDRTDDPQVYTPSLYRTMIGREKYDWCFETVPQDSASGKKYSMPRGKLLGGSSGINYLVCGVVGIGWSGKFWKLQADLMVDVRPRQSG